MTGDELPRLVCATTSGGETYHNIVEFKQIRTRRKDDFGVCLTRKLLTLAADRDCKLHLWSSPADGDTV